MTVHIPAWSAIPGRCPWNMVDDRPYCLAQKIRPGGRGGGVCYGRSSSRDELHVLCRMEVVVPGLDREFPNHAAFRVQADVVQVFADGVDGAGSVDPEVFRLVNGAEEDLIPDPG